MSNKVADKLLADINKTFKSPTEKPVATYARDMAPVEVYSSGSLALDFAIGVGGVPRSRVMEICGKEGCGKTTSALLIARNFIDMEPNRIVAFLDTEHKLTPSWVEKLLGPERMDNLLILNPDHIEQATEMARRLITTGNISVCILDSIGGSPTAQTMDEDRSAEQSESQGGNAKGVTKFARFMVNLSAKYDTLVIGINQQRDDMQSRHGNMLNTPGGRGWKHACVLRVLLKRGSEKYFIKEGGEEIQVGYDIIAQIVKNQLGGTEGRTAQWRFFNHESELYGPVGVDTTEECLRLATIVGVIERAGAYYRHSMLEGGQVQGKAELLKVIKSDESIRTQIVSEVMASLADDPDKLALVSPLQEVPASEKDDFVPAEK